MTWTHMTIRTATKLSVMTAFLPYRVYMPIIITRGESLPAAPGVRVGELLIKQTGIYRVTYEDLLAAGLDLTDQPADDIALTANGVDDSSLCFQCRIIWRRQLY